MRVMSIVIMAAVMAVGVRAGDDEGSVEGPWFESAEAMAAALADGVDDWYKRDRSYLASIAKMKAAFADDVAVIPSETRTCFSGPKYVYEDAESSGDDEDEDEESERERSISELRFVDLYDTPFTGSFSLSKSGKSKDVPFRAWIGRRYSQDVSEDELDAYDVQELMEEHIWPVETPEGEQDWARFWGGELEGASDDLDLVMYVDVPMSDMPPLVNVNVWSFGSVAVSGTKKEVGERAIGDLRSNRKRSFVWSSATDKDLFKGPVTVMCYGKVLKPNDTIEPDVIFGEEKNSRMYTFYSANASYGVVRSSAFEGLLREGKYMATRELRAFTDVFGRSDVVELEFKKSNFATLDKFKITSNLWKELQIDHGDKKRRR